MERQAQDMALKILSQWKTHATENNNNNKLGLFLTLTRLNKKYNYCILELGMNHINELIMSLITKPNIILQMFHQILVISDQRNIFDHKKKFFVLKRRIFF